jgi:hypothetical protein
LYCWLALPFFLEAQPPTPSADKTADMGETPNRAYGLTPEETKIVETGLSKIKPDNYAYLVINATGKGNGAFEFNLWESGVWKTINDKALAELICLNPTYNGKTIVLVSASSLKTTENFAYYLGKFDTEAKRSTRPVIGWELESVVFENGYITGGSTCQMFTPSTIKDQRPTARTLSEDEMPHGKIGSFADVGVNYVILAPFKGILERRLRDSNNHDLEISVIELKKKSKDPKNTGTAIFGLYEKLVADQDAWNAWVYLKKLHLGSHAINDMKVLAPTEAIRKRYFKANIRFQNAFELYFIACPSQNIPDNISGFLPPDPASKTTPQAVQSLTVTAFEQLAKELSKTIFLKDHLAGSFEMALGKTFLKRAPLKVPALSSQTERIKNLSLLATTEPQLAQFMYNTKDVKAFQALPLKEKILSEKTFTALDLILNNAYIDLSKMQTILVGGSEGARQPVVAAVNETIGQNVETIQELKRITSEYTNETASQGSIFEAWVRFHWKKLYKNSKPIPTETGKISFPFDVKKNSNGDETRTLVAKPEDATILKTRRIDGSYTESNLPTDEKKNTLVGVELKHVSGILEGERVEQLKDNAAIAATRLKRIEYIFSSHKAAVANIPNFKTYFLTNRDFKIFYIDENGDMQPLIFQF